MADRKLTTTEIIAKTVDFTAKAKRDGRESDAAYGQGALDALNDRPADYERHGFSESLGRDYLSGWCRVNGF